MIPTFDDVLDAAERLRGVAVHTPLLSCPSLDRAAGGRVLVKAECLQRTGSFKFRGAYNRLSRLTSLELRAGVVAYSSGNHAQGVAAAAQMLGCPALIVMPQDTPRTKLEATRGYGAEIVTYDRFTESREAIAFRIAEQRGAVLVPPFEDPLVIAGQGTAALEVVRQLQAIGARADFALCPASGGGLAAGLALSFEALSPETQLYAVEPAGFADLGRSLQAGVRVHNGATAKSVCDALLSPAPGELAFQILRRRLAGGLMVSDDEALSAVAFAFRHLKLVLEPSGAVALAALLCGRLRLDGGTALVVASGGNVDPELYVRAITTARYVA